RVGRDDLALAGWGIAGFIALCEMDCWGAALAFYPERRRLAVSLRTPTRPSNTTGKLFLRIKLFQLAVLFISLTGLEFPFLTVFLSDLKRGSWQSAVKAGAPHHQDCWRYEW